MLQIFKSKWFGAHFFKTYYHIYTGDHITWPQLTSSSVKGSEESWFLEKGINYQERNYFTWFSRWFWVVKWVIDWAATSPRPQSKPELIICVFTGCTAIQFWWHFLSFNILYFLNITNYEEENREERREKKKREELLKQVLWGGGGFFSSAFFFLFWVLTDAWILKLILYFRSFYFLTSYSSNLFPWSWEESKGNIVFPSTQPNRQPDWVGCGPEAPAASTILLLVNNIKVP